MKNKEKESKLLNKYKRYFNNYFKKLDNGELISPMKFGLEIGDGWYDLLDDLLEFIDSYLTDYKFIDLQFRQVKEKFGGLRLYNNISFNYEDYIDNYNECKNNHDIKPIYYDSEKYTSDYGIYEKIVEILEEKIKQTESESYNTCEICGSKENIGMTSGYIRIICSVCYNDSKRISNLEWSTINK